MNHKDIKNLYERLNSYTAVGNIVGVSRQRIHQIVKNYNNTGKRRLGNKWNYIWKKKCEVCNWRKSTVIHHKDFNNKNDYESNLISLCTSCHQKEHMKHNRILYGNKCHRCGRLFNSEVKEYLIKRALCFNCFLMEQGKASGKIIFYIKNCKLCGLEMKKGDRQNGYHLKCQYKTPEGRKLNNERTKKYYQAKLKNNPEFIKKRNEKNRIAYLKRKKDLH